MRHRFPCTMFAFLLATLVGGPGAPVGPLSLCAQDATRSLLAQRQTARIGLERAWNTQVSVGAFSGELVNVFTHVSATEARYVAEVTWPDGRLLFKGSDLDAFERPLGREGAKAKADEFVARLTSQGIAPKLFEHDTPVVTLYVATSGGSVQAIDAETGETLWLSTVGSTYHPTLACAANEKYVALINGTVLYVLDRKTGGVVWSRSTEGVPGAGPALSRSYIFVPMVDGALEIYSADDPNVPVFRYRATGRSLIQPIITPYSVCWPTDRGHLYVAWANRPGLRYRIETEKPILAAPAYLAGKLYLTSLDGYLYCIQEQGGSVLWSISTGEPISSSPVAIGDTVFVVTDSGELVAVNAENGQLQPGAIGVRQFLAASAERIYCTGKQGELVVLDRASRTSVASLPLFGLNERYTNVMTDRIYMADQHGLVQCLREVSADFPTLHVDLQEITAPPEEEETEASPEAATETPMPMTEADVDDPFAPFGGGEAEGDADGGEAVDPSMDDPFGRGGDADPAEPAADDPFGGGASEPEPATDNPFGNP